jgi:hypothetical protein
LTEVLGTVPSSPPAPLEPPKRFSKFPDLPPELRQMIWRCFFPGRCFVQLFPPCGKECSFLPRICNKRRWWGKRERRLPGPVRDGGISNFEERIGPETLRICKESRDETLRYYIPLFKDEPKATTIYFHSSQDILTSNRGTHLSLKKQKYTSTKFSTF